MEVQNILVVCVGNICRSPAAEALLAAQCPSLNVFSAGLAAPVGKPADPIMVDIAAAHGIDLGSHISKQLNTKLVMRGDLILVMERRHKEAIVGRHPEVAGKVKLLTHWMDNEPVMDPYCKPRPFFEASYNVIENAVGLWSDKLRTEAAA